MSAQKSLNLICEASYEGKMRLSIKSSFPVSLQYPEYSERYFLENVQIKPS